MILFIELLLIHIEGCESFSVTLIERHVIFDVDPVAGLVFAGCLYKVADFALKADVRDNAWLVSGSMRGILPASGSPLGLPFSTSKRITKSYLFLIGSDIYASSFTSLSLFFHIPFLRLLVISQHKTPLIL